MASGDLLLSARDLTVQFPSSHGAVTAVNDVSFDMRAGEVISLVGESGCGKSTLGKAIMGLLPNSAKITGNLRYKGTELVGFGPRKAHPIPGH